MKISIASPGHDLSADETAAVERDLEKIARRLEKIGDDAITNVRINNGNGTKIYTVVLEVSYRKNHITAKAEDSDMGTALRHAREEALRQINDRGRGGHSSYAKHA